VEILGQTKMLYTEGNRTVHLYSEAAANVDAIAVWRETIKRWDAPHDIEAIGDLDRDRILGNIERALRTTNTRLDVI
jgi:hypothetical protein